MSTSYNEGASSVNLDRDVPSNQAAVSSILTENSSSAQILEVKPEGKTRITCPIRVVNNLDFIKLGLWFDWSSPQFLDELESRKNTVQQTELSSISYHVPGGFDWNLHRTGTSRYTFRLTTGDITLLLNRRNSDAVVPNVRLEIGSVSCWSPGYYHTIQRVLQWLKALGGSLKKMKISEIHLAADIIGTDINNLNIENENRWITAAHKFDTHKNRRKFSGVTIGRDKLMLRIYDKVLEVKNSSFKQQVFSEIWGSNPYNQYPVTRVEFQVRREVLKQFGPKTDTINGLVDSLQSIWKYCTQNWARFSGKAVDRNHNQSKSINSPFWNDVSCAQWTGTDKIERQKRRENKNYEMLLSTMTGCALSLAAFDDPAPEDIDHIIGLTQKILSQNITKLYKEDLSKFIEKMKCKRNEIYVNI